MKIKVMIAACLLLAGCQGQSQQPLTKTEDAQVDELLGGLNTNSSERDEATVSGYATQIRHAIQEQLPNPGRWEGKSCLVQIRLAPDGQLMSAEVEKGDPGLCQAVLDALRKAKMPQPPNEKIYQVLKTAVLDFKL
ncbi:MAG: cell envelope integrity protein TolA [Scandinavium sp.]|uniref:cell envelope integrity protein TolA n=1 Tax=Scandinavium sp. TaxID=2830653 RepID=UPI003F403EF1